MSNLNSLLRALVPQFLIGRYRQFRRHREQARNRHKNVEQVFTEIYSNNKWGGARGEFSSGAGTTDESTVSPYVAMVSNQAASEGFSGKTFVDLGCGDFRVGKQLLPLCSHYVGVDVVKSLVGQNQAQYGNQTTRFVHLNIVDDPLPDGDVCFLRQVLQHLSNQQIGAILKKLGKYRWVFITEHYPTDNDAVIPNLDKAHGGDVRVYENSGVYLSEPPFALPEYALSEVLGVPGIGMGVGIDPGVIRTFLYRPPV